MNTPITKEHFEIVHRRLLSLKATAVHKSPGMMLTIQYEKYIRVFYKSNEAKFFQE